MLNAFTLLRMYTVYKTYTGISEDIMTVCYTLSVIHFFVCFVCMHYIITVIGKVYPHTGVTRKGICIYMCNLYDLCLHVLSSYTPPIWKGVCYVCVTVSVKNYGKYITPTQTQCPV